MSFNDNNKGKSSRRKGKGRQNMKSLGAKGAATNANAFVERELAEIRKQMGELGAQWHVRHASVEVNAERDIVNVLCSSNAYVIESDRARMKSDESALPIALFDVRVKINHALSVYYLSQLVSETALSLLVSTAGFQVTNGGTDGAPSADAAAAAWTFPRIIEQVGLSRGVLAILGVLCSDPVYLWRADRREDRRAPFGAG